MPAVFISCAKKRHPTKTVIHLLLLLSSVMRHSTPRQTDVFNSSMQVAVLLALLTVLILKTNQKVIAIVAFHLSSRACLLELADVLMFDVSISGIIRLNRRLASYHHFNI